MLIYFRRDLFKKAVIYLNSAEACDFRNANRISWKAILTAYTIQVFYLINIFYVPDTWIYPSTKCNNTVM